MSTRKHLFLSICLIAALTCQAESVSQQQALIKAQHFLQGKVFAQPQKARRLRPTSQVTEANAYYIFNVEDGGFVIVSGDDRMPDILGYSDKGNVDMQNIPCNMEWLMSCYAHTLDSLDAYGITKKMSPRRTSNFATIEPLVTTTWGQHAPYNKYCPEIDGEKCPTGCVATAMAQIINYKKWPQGQTTTVDGYTTYSGINMPALEPTSFDWENMTDDDIARLMLYCGQAAKMNYLLSGSGAGEPSEALKTVFGYSNSTKSWLIKMFEADHLEQTVYDELVEDRPVFYTGYSDSMGEGHAFIVDGYKDGMFHINWGWDGDADGYFIITGLTEDVMPFLPNWGSDMVVGIEPRAQNGEQAKVFVNSMESWMRSTYRKDATEDFLFPINITNEIFCEYDITCYVGYGLYDGDNLVKVLSPSEKTFPLPDSFYGQDVFVGSDVPQGTYTLCIVYRHGELGVWQKASGSNQSRLYAYVGEKSLYIKNFVDEWDGHYQDFGYQEINGVTYGLTFEFNTNWAYVLPYQLTGKYSGDIVVPFTFNYDGKEFKVRSIRGSSPFEGCENLNTLSVSIDQGLEIYNCPNLSQLQLQQGNNFVIHSCPKLEEIVFPVTTQWLDISDCENLKTIKLTNLGTTFSVPKFEAYFYPSLTDVYFASTTPPDINGYDETYYNPQVTIHVPKGSLPFYQNSQWKLWNIVDDNAEASLVKWGYCHHDNVSGYGMALGSKGDDVAQELAMRVDPEDMVAYKGCKITHIEIFSSTRAQNDWGYEDYEYIFISNRETDYLLKQPINIIRGAWNSIKLDEPFTITGEELFIGFGRKGAIGIQFSDDTFVPDAVWERFMSESPESPYFKTGAWDYAKECPFKEGPSALKAHPLPLRFAIEGENVPEGVVLRELEIEGSGSSASRALSHNLRSPSESGITINGVIRNRSLETVSSYTIEYIIDGKEKQSKTYNSMLAPNETEVVTLELPNLSDGKHVITTNVTMVNDKANQLEGLNMPELKFTLLNGIITWDNVIPGDANGDGEVNVSDIVEIVNDIMGKTSAKFVRDAADMNNDGEINVTDIVKVVSIIMSANNGARMKTPLLENTDNDFLVMDGNDDHTISLALNNAGGYVASQFDVWLSGGTTLEGMMLNNGRSNGHLMTYSKMGDNLYRVVIYSPENHSYVGNEGELLKIKTSGIGDVEIDNILFITESQAEKRFSPLRTSTTGIQIVETTPESMDIYSLDGRQVSTDGNLQQLPKGAYIMNKKKVIMK